MKLVGQEQTLKETKNATSRIIEIFKASNGEIKPHFILTGPSGSGKSHLMKYLSQKFTSGFLKGENLKMQK